MKKLLLIGFALILLGLTSKAASIEGNFTGTAFQGETLTRTLELCNDSEQGKVILLEAGQENSEWIILRIGQEEEALSPGECRNVYLFLTPKHFTPPQEYELSILGPEIQKTFYLQVLQGHTLSLSIDEETQEASQCQEKEFNLLVENTGLFNEEVELSLEGIPESWHNLDTAPFFLAKGGFIEFPLKVKAPCNQALDSYEFSVKAEMFGAWFTASENASIELVNSQINSITLPTETRACNDLATEASISVENTGRLADEVIFSLTGEEWAHLSHESAELQPQESIDLTVLFAENTFLPQKFEFELNVKSLKFGTTYSKKFLVSLEDCYEVQVKAVELPNEACLEERPELVFEVTNSGSREIELNAGFVDGDAIALLSKKTVFLESGESTELTVELDLSNEIQRRAVYALTLDSDKLSVRKEFELELIDCFDLGMEIVQLNPCKCIDSSAFITVSNTGTKTQSIEIEAFPLWVLPKTPLIELEAGQSREIELLLKPSCEETGDQLKLTISTEKNLVSKTARISFRNSSECFGLEILAPLEELELTRSEAEMFELTLKNTGLTEQEVIVSVEGIEWAYFKPTKLVLGKGEEKEFYIYLSPPYDLQEEELTITVNAQTNYGFKASRDLELVVSGGPTGLRIVKTDIIVGEATIEEIGESKRTRLSVLVTLFNDSTSSIEIADINAEGFDAEFSLPEEKIPAGKEAQVTMSLILAEGFEEEKFFVPLNVLTDKGLFLKIVEVEMPTETKETGTGLTGFSVLGSAEQIALIVLAALVVLSIGYFALQGKPKKKSKAKAKNKSNPGKPKSKPAKDKKKKVLKKPKK